MLKSILLKAIIAIFALIGLIVVIVWVGMLFMHGNMMDMMQTGGMFGRTMPTCSDMLTMLR
jgi:hypothetical protein